MIKHIHLLTVTISISLFVLRGIWKFTGSAMMQQRWIRVVPHINDAVLLGSAIMLSVRMQQYPFVHAWLTAKVTALIVYILLGMVVFRWGRTRRSQMTAWFMALLVFAYIVITALQHEPYWFLF